MRIGSSSILVKAVTGAPLLLAQKKGKEITYFPFLKAALARICGAVNAPSQPLPWNLV